ncbi:MAG: response regulator transcription factor [Deltaproteobacteria bacterium]
MAGKSVLIVDDDAEIRASLARALRADGIEPREAASGEEALAMFAADPADLVILDIRMPPGMDGLEVCRRLRATSEVPLIFLSEVDGNDDQVMGIELGAWDYVSKEDFSPILLRAKIRNFLQLRKAPQGQPAAGRGDLEFDEMARTFRWRGNLLQLTATQTGLLEALARWPNKVWSRSALNDAVHPDVTIQPKTIDSHIAGIRKILRALDVPRGTVILTRPGIGYQLGHCK